MRRITDDRAIPLRGGVITSTDRSLLDFGRFSRMRNLRNRHPGVSRRRGYSRQHAVPYGNSTVLSLYQYRKASYGAERHLYAQMSDGKVLEAAVEPPGVSFGGFGDVVFSGSGGQVPASWATLKDTLLVCNGRDQPQIFVGNQAPILNLFVNGVDYTEEVTDENESTVAPFVLHAGIYAYIRTMVPINRLSFIVASPNTNVSTLVVSYWRGYWQSVPVPSDGTAVSAKTLARSGDFTWELPAAEISTVEYGASGFWYRITVTGESNPTSNNTAISEIRCSAPWQPIKNVWDGAPQYAIEVRVDREADGKIYTYSAGAVDLGGCVVGAKIMVATTDPISGLYIDPGATPNDVQSGVLSGIKLWNGSGWVSVGTFDDGTAGLSRAGWVRFKGYPAQPHNLLGHITAYWYEITIGRVIPGNTVVSIQFAPVFDVEGLGSGYCVAAWKDRAVYSFDRYGSYIYISAKDNPMVLNGADYGILQAGDGRRNKIVAMRKFYNELLVWQEELGEEGGCITLFEGYSPSTFGKIVLSSRIGAMNAKSVAVVDGVLTSTATDETIKTLAFCLSRHGVCVIDGRTVSIISDDIRNYFDPSRPECIRRGYEHEMWLQYDATENVLRLGLVSGKDATAPNVFPVYDLVTKTWSFDTPAAPISCMTNVEPGSGGSSTFVQVGGGHGTGRVYIMNSGDDDDGDPIESELGVALNLHGRVLALQRMVVRCMAQDHGAIRVEVFENGILRATKVLPMEADRPGEGNRRHFCNLNVVGQSIEVVFKNSPPDAGFFLLDAGFRVSLWEER